MARYVALLRGINVGGKNLIKMSALKTCLEGCGFRDVTTYIQSGNVIFESPGSARALAGQIEETLSGAFNYSASVVLRSRAQMRAIVDRAPRGFGADPAKYRYDVVFLKEPLTAARAIEQVPTRAGVDESHPGAGVLYFSRLIAKATQSLLPKLSSMPIYQQMTIRNWNTTTSLARMIDK